MLPCVVFFGRLKKEMFYYRKWSGVGIEDCGRILDDCIQWYNEKRSKESFGDLSPLDYRLKMG